MLLGLYQKMNLSFYSPQTNYTRTTGVYVIDEEVLSYSISKPKKINTIEIRGGDK